jgi:serine/threonine-protein kinase OSR1/STK39
MRGSRSEPGLQDLILPLDKSQYQLLHLIGRGSHGYSEVYAARCIPTGRLVAIKLIYLDRLNFNLDNIRRERALWSTCRHAHLIRDYGSFVSDSILWWLMEYMDGGSVSDIMRFAYPRGFESESVIATILCPVLQFAAYIHKREQLDRAFCTNNILLTMQGEVKISDLGSATGLIRSGKRQCACFSFINSSYAAPEGLDRIGYTEKSDIWSIGIIAIALATGQAPFEAMTPIEQIPAIVKGPSPDLPTGSFSLQMRDFVHQCLQKDPEKRPNAAELLKHAFIKKSKGRDFLAGQVMSLLPPLSQRFEIMHRHANVVSPEAPALHPSIAFDFAGHEEKVEEPPKDVEQPELKTVAQIGRFKVVVQRRPLEVIQKSSTG